MEKKEINNTEKKELFPENLSDSPKYQKGVKKAQESISNILFKEEDNVKERQYTYAEKDLDKDFDGSENSGVHPILKEMTNVYDPDNKNHDPDGYYKKLGMKNLYINRINNIIVELGQNAIKHSAEGYPVKISIYEQIENGEPFIYVETKNFIDISTDKQKESRLLFKRKMRQANSLTKDEVKAKYIETMDNGIITGKSAGLGFRDMSKKTKENDKDKPFKYEFKKQTSEDGKEILFAKISCKINVSKSGVADKIGVKNDLSEKKDIAESTAA